VPSAPPQEPATLHIADLDDETDPGFSTRRIEAHVGIWVHDSAHHAVPYVSVRASWSGGATGTTRCTTNDLGYCQMASRTIDNQQGIMLTMTVRAFDNPEYEFDKKLNHEPDGDSNGTVIRIQR
jgi:hypothetical protein